MANRVWPVDAVSGAPLYSGRMLRQSLMAPLTAGATATRPLGARSGVRPGTSTTTVTATSTTWTCCPHAGILDVEAAAEAGPYGYSIDDNATGSVTAANATNPRVDIIYVQLSDPAEADGTSTPGVAVGYLAGTAAPSPAPPAAPARSIAIAQINVPQAGNGSPTVTWVAPYAVAAGGIAPAPSLPSPVLGTTAARTFVEVGGSVYAGDGTAWTYVGGVAPLTSTGAGGGALTAGWAPSTTPPSLSLTAGTWLLSASANFSLSTSSRVIIEALIWNVTTAAGINPQAKDSVDATSGDTSKTLEMTRIVTLPSAATISLYGRTSAAGGTQAWSGNQLLIAVRIG